MSQVVIDYKHISGILPERDAQYLLTELEMRQIPSSEVSVLMSEHTSNSVIKMEGATKGPEGVTIGGISGGIIGAVIGGLTLVGTVLAPGLGLMVAGPLIGILAGTAAGAGAGGLIGGLIGLGIPEHEARYYEDALKEEGNMMIVVRVHKEMTDEIKALFQRFDAQCLHVNN